MKKLITALMGAGLLVSLNSYATSSSCSNAGYSSGLCAPKMCGGFYVGLTGLYQRPTVTGEALNGESYQFSDSDVFPSFFRSELRRFDPDHDWGYEIKVGYDLPCTANNIELSYTHFDDDVHLHSDLTGDPFSVASYYFPNISLPTTGLLSLTALAGSSRINWEFNKADLTIGRRYEDACGNFMIRPAIGVRHAKIEHHYHSNTDLSIGLTPVPGVVLDTTDLAIGVDIHSEFKGTGPLFSVDARWGLFNSIGLVGHFDSALLVGDVDTHDKVNLAFTFATDSLIAPTINTAPVVEERFETPSVDRIVTSLTGRIGLDYNYCFCNKSSLSIEVGYQASKYYDAVDIIRGPIANPFSLNAGGFPALQTTSTQTEDFDLRGPYVNVTFHV